MNHPRGTPPVTPPRLGPALLGEFVGTAALIVVGVGANATDVLLNDAPDRMGVALAWGLAVALGVYLSGRLSGGHLNPAVTLALAARGDVPWGRVGPYIGAQVLAAFLGSLLVYADYSGAFGAFEGAEGIVRGGMEEGKLAGEGAGGAGVFGTYPKFDGVGRNLLSEVLGTAVLLLGVRALTDRRNAAPGGYVEPLALGGLVVAIGLGLGGPTGYAINPARDLGPRLASAVLGWGSAPFRSHGWYFWIPIVGPLVGGLIGSTLYDLAIGRHLPPKDRPSPPGELSP